MDEELQGCEHCEKEFPLETMRMMSDAWFCEACTEEWQEIFDNCQHEWSPYVDAMGGDGRICERCSGFVANDTFDAIFGDGASAVLGGIRNGRG